MGRFTAVVMISVDWMVLVGAVVVSCGVLAVGIVGAGVDVTVFSGILRWGRRWRS